MAEEQKDDWAPVDDWSAPQDDWGAAPSPVAKSAEQPGFWGNAADVAKSAGIGVVKGAIGLAGLPGDISRLAEHGSDWVGNKLGLPPATEEMKKRQHSSQPFTSGEIQKGVESVTGEFYKPKSIWGEYAQTGGEFLPAIAAGPGGLARRAASQVALPAVASESAGQLTKGTAAEPWARIAGAIAPGGMGAAARYVGSKVARPLTEGGRELLAGQVLEHRATDAGAARNSLDTAQRELVPGSQPTTFQLTGDVGLGALEREVAAINPDRFMQLRAEQNKARLGQLENLQTTGNPQEIPKLIQSQLAVIESDTQRAVEQATALAQSRAATIGGGNAQEVVGAELRTALQTAENNARAQERKLWNAVDPNGDLTVNMVPVTQAAKEIYGNLSHAATASLKAEEQAIVGIISNYKGVESFQELKDLRSLVSEKMREELSTAGRTQTYGRLSMLRRDIEGVINNSIVDRSMADAANVAAGKLAPEQSLVSRIQQQVQEWKTERSARDASAIHTGEVAEAGPAVLPTTSRGSSQGSERSGNVAGDHSVPEDPSLFANFDQAAAGRLRAASNATLERAQTFNVDPLKGILRREQQSGPYKTLPSAVPDKIFKPGPTGFETVNQYRNAVGDAAALPILSEYVSGSVRRAAMNPDGTLNPARFEQWRNRHSEALRAFPELEQQFTSAAQATERIADVTAARRVALDQQQSGALAKFLNINDPQDVTRVIGSVFGSKTAMGDMKAIYDGIKHNPEAVEGLRKSIADHIMQKFISNTEATTSGRPLIRADQFQTFIKNNEGVLSIPFTKEEVKSLKAVADDLQRANRSIVAVKIPGQSNTAQDLTALAGHSSQQSWLTKLLVDASTAGGTFAASASPVLALGSAGIAHVVNAARNAGFKKVDDIVRDAMLNPELAKTLMQRAYDNKMNTNNLARKLTAVGAAAALSAEQERPRKFGGRVKGYADGGTPIGSRLETLSTGEQFYVPDEEAVPITNPPQFPVEQPNYQELPNYVGSQPITQKSGFEQYPENLEDPFERAAFRTRRFVKPPLQTEDQADLKRYNELANPLKLFPTFGELPTLGDKTPTPEKLNDLLFGFHSVKGDSRFRTKRGFAPIAEGERYQTWPEQMVRSGTTLAGDVATGHLPATESDPSTGEFRTNPEMIHRAQDLAGLMGGSSIKGVPEGALGTTGSKLPPGWKIVEGAKEPPVSRGPMNPRIEAPIKQVELLADEPAPVKTATMSEQTKSKLHDLLFTEDGRPKSAREYNESLRKLSPLDRAELERTTPGGLPKESDLSSSSHKLSVPEQKFDNIFLDLANYFSERDGNVSKSQLLDYFTQNYDIPYKELPELRKYVNAAIKDNNEGWTGYDKALLRQVFDEYGAEKLKNSTLLVRSEGLGQKSDLRENRFGNIFDNIVKLFSDYQVYSNTANSPVPKNVLLNALQKHEVSHQELPELRKYITKLVEEEGDSWSRSDKDLIRKVFDEYGALKLKNPTLLSDTQKPGTAIAALNEKPTFQANVAPAPQLPAVYEPVIKAKPELALDIDSFLKLSKIFEKRHGPDWATKLTPAELNIIKSNPQLIDSIGKIEAAKNEGAFDKILNTPVDRRNFLVGASKAISVVGNVSKLATVFEKAVPDVVDLAPVYQKIGGMRDTFKSLGDKVMGEYYEKQNAARDAKMAEIKQIYDNPVYDTYRELLQSSGNSTQIRKIEKQLSASTKPIEEKYQSIQNTLDQEMRQNHRKIQDGFRKEIAATKEQLNLPKLDEKQQKVLDYLVTPGGGLDHFVDARIRQNPYELSKISEAFEHAKSRGRLAKDEAFYEGVYANDPGYLLYKMTPEQKAQIAEHIKPALLQDPHLSLQDVRTIVKAFPSLKGFQLFADAGNVGAPLAALAKSMNAKGFHIDPKATKGFWILDKDGKKTDYWFDSKEKAEEFLGGSGSSISGPLGGLPGARAAFQEHIGNYIPEKDFQRDFFAGMHSPQMKMNLFAGNVLDFDGPLVSNGERAGFMSRSIDFKNGIAHHNNFELYPGLQGSGIAKKMLANQVEAYHRLGLKRVETFADVDIGSYAWAKYGFLPVSAREWGFLAEKATKRLDNLVKADKVNNQDARILFKMLESKDPKAIWNVTDYTGTTKSGQPISKELLINNSWDANLELYDQASMDRFYRYIKKGQ